VTYMSAQEQSNKLEVIAIRGFIIFPATVWSSQEPDGSRGFRNATIVPQKRENCPLPRTWRAYAGLSLEAVSPAPTSPAPTIGTEHSSTITVSTSLAGWRCRTFASRSAHKHSHDQIGDDRARNGEK